MSEKYYAVGYKNAADLLPVRFTSGSVAKPFARWDKFWPGGARVYELVPVDPQTLERIEDQQGDGD